MWQKRSWQTGIDKHTVQILAAGIKCCEWHYISGNCCFVIHDDFNSQTPNTLPNGFFTYPSLNSNSSNSDFEWISVLFRAIFPLNAWENCSESQSISHWCSCIALGYKLPDFHWSTDLLTSTHRPGLWIILSQWWHQN